MVSGVRSTEVPGRRLSPAAGFRGAAWAQAPTTRRRGNPQPAAVKAKVSELGRRSKEAGRHVSKFPRN